MTSSEFSFQPVVIIGAGRSGTNMLRNVLTKIDGVGTWPCDEINYIWRYGNRDHPTDEFLPSMVTPKITRYIRCQFNSMDKRLLEGLPIIKNRFIVEKTCANSLRVDYVHSILPEAKYLYIVRDGRDVVASAQKRWKAPLDIPYLYAKTRFVPKNDLAYYAFKYFKSRLSKVFSGNNAISVWGPKFEGMLQISSKHRLEYVCAMQWLRCVSLSDAAFQLMPENKVFKLRYEDFVADPELMLAALCRFLELDLSPENLKKACADVRVESIGKGRKGISENDSDWLELLQPALERYRYI